LFVSQYELGNPEGFCLQSDFFDTWTISIIHYE
jgi:hypothetical protein